MDVMTSNLHMITLTWTSWRQTCSWSCSRERRSSSRVHACQMWTQHTSLQCIVVPTPDLISRASCSPNNFLIWSHLPSLHFTYIYLEN
jgi:hypothetical protein